MQIRLPIAGLIVGSVVTWLVLKYKHGAEKSRLEERNVILNDRVEKLENELVAGRSKINELNSTLASSRTENENMKEKLQDRKTELDTKTPRIPSN